MNRAVARFLEQRLGIGSGFSRDAGAGQHARQFVDAFIALQRLDVGFGARRFLMVTR